MAWLTLSKLQVTVRSGFLLSGTASALFSIKNKNTQTGIQALKQKQSAIDTLKQKQHRGGAAETLGANW